MGEIVGSTKWLISLKTTLAVSDNLEDLNPTLKGQPYISFMVFLALFRRARYSAAILFSFLSVSFFVSVVLPLSVFDESEVKISQTVRKLFFDCHDHFSTAHRSVKLKIMFYRCFGHSLLSVQNTPDGYGVCFQKHLSNSHNAPDGAIWWMLQTARSGNKLWHILTMYYCQTSQ